MDVGAALGGLWRGHPLFAAVYQWLSPALESGPIGTARRELLHDARGVVVDLGVNLSHLGESVTKVHLVEPDVHVIQRLNPALPEHVLVHQVGAENLPLPDASVDTVLATLTLRTVTDLSATTCEIRRVLRPGGQVLVLEHVRSLDRRTALLQDYLQLPWSCLSAGCRPNRDSVGALAEQGLDIGRLRRFSVPGMGLGLAREWVTGRLTKP